MTLETSAISARTGSRLSVVADQGGGRAGRAVSCPQGRPVMVVLGGDATVSDEAQESEGRDGIVAQICDSLEELTGKPAEILTKDQVLELLRR